MEIQIELISPDVRTGHNTESEKYVDVFLKERIGYMSWIYNCGVGCFLMKSSLLFLPQPASVSTESQ
jgi:hypothetical protein